jgi:hypothetical protein
MKTMAMLLLISLSSVAVTRAAEAAPMSHPDSAGWEDLFAADLSNAICPKGVWSVKDGELSATADQAILSEKQYEQFVLDFEFKTSPHANSGVILHASDLINWIPNSVEIQLADTFREGSPTNTNAGECAAIYGHVAPKKQLVKKPGEWNRMTVTCKDAMIYVVFNGELVAEMDMTKYTSAKQNPDGSDIPAHLSRPIAELPRKGHIGFQGLHGKAPTYFRNIKVKAI